MSRYSGKTVLTCTRTVAVSLLRGSRPDAETGQGNDVGTQYRSAIFTTSTEQAATACRVADRFGESLRQAGFDPLATEIAPSGPFLYAEPYHQQYLEANPRGYCALGGTGVSCPIGLTGA
jgi:peptide-methionine (S)-S-oxide reductase